MARGYKCTAGEDALLRDAYLYCERWEVAVLLDRSVNAVNIRLRQLGLVNLRGRPWTSQEKELAADLRRSGTYKDVGALLERSPFAVKEMLWTMGVPRPARQPDWSALEVDLLRTLSEDMTNREIAALLGRTPSAVSRRIVSLGLSSFRLTRRWSHEEDTMLRRLWPVGSGSAVAALVERTESAVNHRAAELALAKDSAYLVSIGHHHRFFPPELREAIKLRDELRKALKNAKHRDIA